MKINKKLKAAISFNPTKKSHQKNIQDMCKDIKQDKLTLPLYQRDVSWTLQKSVDLLNYQLFGKAPVAPISINQITNLKTLIPQVSFIERNIVDSEKIEVSHQSVVDGQQRLTTNFKAYIDHEDFRSIVLDVSSAKFCIIDKLPKENQIPVGILLNEERNMLQTYLEQRNLISELYPILIDVRSKLMDYNYTINIAENLEEDEQIKWFEVLNNAGSKVTALQMSFSKLKLHNFDIYSDFVNPFRDKLSNFGFEDLFSPYTTNVSYPVSSLNPAYEVIKKDSQHNLNWAPIPSDTKEDSLTELDTDTLLAITEYTLECLDKALIFIEKNELNDIITRMDYILYILGYFAFKNDFYDEKEETFLIDWVKTVNFSNKSNGERRKIFKNLIV